MGKGKRTLKSSKSSQGGAKKKQKGKGHGNIFYKSEYDPEQDLVAEEKTVVYRKVPEEKPQQFVKKVKTKKKKENLERKTAYESLVSSLHFSGKYKELFKRKKLEEEGLEDEELEEEEEENVNSLEVEEDEDEEGEEFDEDEDELQEEDQEAEEGENEQPEDFDEGEKEKSKKPQEEQDIFVDYETGEDEAAVLESNLNDSGFEEENKEDVYVQHFDNMISDDEIQAGEKKANSSQVIEGLGMVTSNTPLPKTRKPRNYHIKLRLLEKWEEFSSNAEALFTPLQEKLFPMVNDYYDLFYASRTFSNSKEIRDLYVLHALNHVLKTRDKILKSNAKLNSMDSDKRALTELRDQGFTRARVLILLPFKHSALEVVQTIIKLSPKVQQDMIIHKSRFLEEFGVEEEENVPNRPAEYNEIFKGNVDDYFRMGVSFTRKSIKLYSDFYSADIIIASPLGMRLAIKAEKEKGHDFDFLSSIEMVILDQTDIFLMQNWEHIQYTMSFLNKMPKKTHKEIDFSRVKEWYLNGWAKHYRQTLMFSSFVTPEMNALFQRMAFNIKGKIKIKPEEYKGSIYQVIPKIQQIFHRLQCDSLELEDNVRFHYFVNEILAPLRKSTNFHTLIFIPSYFDYVRVRNYFRQEEISYCQCCEYTTTSNISRARSNFFHGRLEFLIYTERFHFFHRYRIRGIHNIIFYQLPLYPQLYPEMLNLIEEPDSACTILFSKFDKLRLEHVVGSQAAKKILKSSKPTFLFC